MARRSKDVNIKMTAAPVFSSMTGAMGAEKKAAQVAAAMGETPAFPAGRRPPPSDVQKRIERRQERMDIEDNVSERANE